MKRVMIYFWCVDIFWSACGHYVQNREEDTARMQEVYNLEKVSLYFDTLSVKLPHFIMQKNFQYFDTLCILLTWIYRLLWCTDLWVYFGDWRCGTGWFHKSSCVTILNSGCFLYAEKRALRGNFYYLVFVTTIQCFYFLTGLQQHGINAGLPWSTSLSRERRLGI
jgi:hypothetical protein